MKKLLLVIFTIVFSTIAVRAQDVTETILEKSASIFGDPETQPEFPGGNLKLFEFLRKNLKYPNDAKLNRIQGRVLITFVVERDGSLSNFRIIKRLSSSTDAEALRVIAMSPKWIPSMQLGKPVRVQYAMPVKFEL